MAPQINFNHPGILSGNLEQLISQMDLRDFSLRIHVGRSEGVGYALFGDKFYYMNLKNTFNAIDDIRTFFDAVYTYLDLAKEHATRFGFKLLASNKGGAFEEITPASEIFTLKYHSDSAYGLVIGDQSIESVERLVRFLEMVKEGKPILDQQYQDVKTAGRPYLQ